MRATLSRTIRRPRSALRLFLRSEALGGIALITAAIAALFVANSLLAPSYFRLLETPLGPLTVQHWINDGAMALFFFVVGLEIKREWIDGHLSTWADRRLPLIAAATGMLFPALVYLAVTRGDAALTRGWAIPAATDIAFALGVLALLGKRVPASLKLFLTTVAIVDDMGAVAIIAVAYTATIDYEALLGAGLVIGAMMLMNLFGVVNRRWYLFGLALLWLELLHSGIHPTVAGVLAALTVPLRPTPGAPDSDASTLHSLENALNPWVAYLIVPLFGFANAGVSLTGIGITDILAPLPLGIAFGLIIGKQAGVFGGVWLAVRLGIARRPSHAAWLHIYGVALLCGIGFTMSLFIGGLAFADVNLVPAVKIGVLIGSLVSALAGALVLLLAAHTAPLSKL